MSRRVPRMRSRTILVYRGFAHAGGVFRARPYFKIYRLTLRADVFV